MKIFNSIMAVTFSLLMVLSLACGKKSGASNEVKEGGSCKGISAMEGKMACDGQKIIVCSSYTNYIYKATQTCGEGKKCTVAPGGKSASCK